MTTDDGLIITKLSDFKEKIEHELELFFNKKIRQAKITEDFSKEMIETIKEFTMRGGKRIRPALVYYGYKCFSNKESEEIIKASVSIELIQSFLLIHDDIIDNDDFRRGFPTVHKIYEERYGKEYGKSLAIHAGDLAAFLAVESILELNMEDSKKIIALKTVNDAVQKVIYGQTLDVFSTSNKSLTAKDIFKIHNLKTAKYTFEGPLLIGASLSGAKESDIEKLKDYSYRMGLAFQLKDDILGLFGDEEKLGKPVGSDLKEGKKTLLILKALECSCSIDKELVESILGKKDLTKKDIELVREAVIESGSLDYSKKMMIEFINDAKKIIQTTDWNEEGKTFLIQLADHLKEREN